MRFRKTLNRKWCISDVSLKACLERSVEWLSLVTPLEPAGLLLAGRSDLR